VAPWQQGATFKSKSSDTHKDKEIQMTDQNMNEDEVTVEQPDELGLLKERADLMGITYHPNIGIEKLKAKIEEKTKGVQPLDEYAEEEAETIRTAAQVEKDYDGSRPMTKQQLKAKKRREQLRLVRIRVANMNPIKAALKGEILSVGNADIGFVKKFIPFNAEQGWHVPQIILTQLQAKKFMTHYEVKMGNKRVKKHKLIPEYSIEILPPLTAKELEALRQRQIIANQG
jgi:hypothetical protein